MSRKPRLLLLDAGAIFAAMHHQAWDALVEEALDACGWSKPVDRRFSREFVKEHLQEGSIRKIQGRGLAD